MRPEIKKIIPLVVIFLGSMLSYPFARAATVTTHLTSTRQVVAPQLFGSNQSNAIVDDFLISSTSVRSIISGVQTGYATTSDVVYNAFNLASYKDTCNVAASPSLTDELMPTFFSLDPTKGTIDSSGNTAWVSDGQATFGAKVGRRVRGVLCQLSYTLSAETLTFNHFISTSTIATVESWVDNAINGLDASPATYDLYSSVDDTTKTYVRNPGLFAAAVDFSAIPVLEVTGSSGKTQCMGALASADIMIGANHCHPASGTVVYFVTSTSATISRTISSVAEVGGTDIEVMRLDRPILSGSGITIPKVLPSDAFYHRITSSALSYGGLLAINTNQFRTLRLRTIQKIFTMVNQSDGNGHYGEDHYYDNSGSFASASPYYPWSSTIVSGDSGSATFIVIDGQPVLLGTWFSSLLSSDVSLHMSAINTAIAALGSPYPLTSVDLSGFPTY